MHVNIIFFDKVKGFSSLNEISDATVSPPLKLDIILLKVDFLLFANIIILY